VHLTAAGLLNRKCDCVAETFEHTDYGNPRLGEERVIITGNKERDSQLKL